ATPAKRVSLCFDCQPAALCRSDYRAEMVFQGHVVYSLCLFNHRKSRRGSRRVQSGLPGWTSPSFLSGSICIATIFIGSTPPESEVLEFETCPGWGAAPFVSVSYKQFFRSLYGFCTKLPSA